MVQNCGGGLCALSWRNWPEVNLVSCSVRLENPGAHSWRTYQDCVCRAYPCFVQKQQEERALYAFIQVLSPWWLQRHISMVIPLTLTAALQQAERGDTASSVTVSDSSCSLNGHLAWCCIKLVPHKQWGINVECWINGHHHQKHTCGLELYPTLHRGSNNTGRLQLLCLHQSWDTIPECRVRNTWLFQVIGWL